MRTTGSSKAEVSAKIFEPETRYWRYEIETRLRLLSKMSKWDQWLNVLRPINETRGWQNVTNIFNANFEHSDKFSNTLHHTNLWVMSYRVYNQ